MNKYNKIIFEELNVGDEFRYDPFVKSRFKNKKTVFPVCVKTGDLTFIEKRSKKEHRLWWSYITVRSLN